MRHAFQSDPRVIEASIEATKSHGVGLSSVRFICGTTVRYAHNDIDTHTLNDTHTIQDLHVALEEKLARFHGKEAAILYSSCFDANGGFFEALFSGEDAIISDELNHASIIDGVRLCRARRWRYANGDVGDLQRRLEEARDCRLRLVATDGVFSMDGKIAPLR